MAVCQSCREALVITLAPDEDDTSPHRPDAPEETVPDDLHLPCGCHFHWQCLHDAAAAVAVSLCCPSCDTYLLTNAPGPSVTNAYLPAPPHAPRLPAHYTNEGGVQDGLDLLPSLTEEALLLAHPEARPARAFHTMAAEGDVAGMVDVLRDVEADADVDIGAAGLLRWPDPLNGGKTVMHVALEARQEEVVWLLLWLRSRVPETIFPHQAVSAARGMGVDRTESVPKSEDVRFVKDGQGRDAVAVAAEIGAPWGSYLDAGLFAA